MTEVMDCAPGTLTHREHKIAIILAEDARDGEPGELDDQGREKRVIWQSVESPEMLRRFRVSRVQLYEVLAALVAKGCIERTMRGGGGHRAKYRFPALRPAALRPLNPDTENGICVTENVTQVIRWLTPPADALRPLNPDALRPLNPDP